MSKQVSKFRRGLEVLLEKYTERKIAALGHSEDPRQIQDRDYWYSKWQAYRDITEDLAELLGESK